MDWLWKFMISFLANSYIEWMIIPVHALPPGFLDGDPYNQDEDQQPSPDKNLDDPIKFLSSMLVQSWPNGMSPLLYIDNENEDQASLDETQILPDSPFLLYSNVHDKRSKYYRKYPLKRQNRYSRYDAENRYMCLPSKDDVFRLLVALHESRQGGRGKTVQFCNRRRPAKAVFTNIRFLGK